MKDNIKKLLLRHGWFTLMAILMFSLLSAQCSKKLGENISGETPEEDQKEAPEKPHSQDSEAEKESFNKLLDAIRSENYRNVSEREVEAILKLYTSNGSFSDINYKNRHKTQWEPLMHLDRLTKLVYAYTTSGTSYYESSELYDKIVKCIQYWYDVNPYSYNWWMNQIGEPQRLGVILIQMRLGKSKIPKLLEKKTLDRMANEGGNPEQKTGANRSDIALHWIYRACLLEDSALLRKSLNYIYSVVTYTEGDGIQYDNSYFQHGRQLYIGGYGEAFLRAITRVANWTKGTLFALSPEQINLLSDFIIDTYYRTIRGGYMSYNVLGRSISRKHSLRKTSTNLLSKMKGIDPTHATEYDNILARISGVQKPGYNLKSSHRHYYIADYTSHIRPKYSFDVRFSSKFTSRCETGNNENLKGYFITDGSTNIAVDGDEYYDIFPYWNWTRIPGTTTPQIATIPFPSQSWENPGNSRFAGGVSDGLYGASAYSYYDKFRVINTGGNKSWFFFDDEIVCLGNVFSSNHAVLNTTVNQCHKKGNVVDEDNWVYHNKIGYLFPNKENVWVETEIRSGSWKSINKNQSDDIQRGEVFALGFKHDKKTNSSTIDNPLYNPYAYIVVPGIVSASDMRAYAKNYNDVIEIVQNSENIQAVYHKTLNILQTIFFSSNGVIKYDGIEIKANKKCAIMLNLNTKKLYVSNPSRAKIVIKVSIKIKDGKASDFKADFSDLGLSAGKTLSFNI